MRKQNSLYNEVVTFINGLDIGTPYHVKDLIFFAGPKENVTAWKLSYNNPHYRIRSYQSMMGGILGTENAFYTQRDKLKLELTKEEARHLLNCLVRTSAKGKDLDVSEMIEDKLVNFLNDV